MKALLFSVSAVAVFASSAAAQTADPRAEARVTSEENAAERGVRMWKSEPVDGEDLVIVASTDKNDLGSPLDITMTGTERSVDWPASLNSIPAAVQNP